MNHKKFKLGDRVRAVNVVDHENECGWIVDAGYDDGVVTVLMDNDRQRYFCLSDFLELEAANARNDP